jgi:hypothetical protein
LGWRTRCSNSRREDRPTGPTRPRSAGPPCAAAVVGRDMHHPGELREFRARFAG